MGATLESKFGWMTEKELVFTSFGASSTFTLDEFAIYPKYLSATEVGELAKGPLVMCAACTVNNYCNGSSAITACPSLLLLSLATQLLLKEGITIST